MKALNTEMPPAQKCQISGRETQIQRNREREGGIEREGGREVEIEGGVGKDGGREERSKKSILGFIANIVCSTEMPI